MSTIDLENILRLFPKSDAVQDKPDKRDFIHEDVFWGTTAGSLPEKVIYSNTLSQNQNIINNPSTFYACVFYAMTHATNEQNFLEWRDNPQYEDIQKFEELSAAYNSKKAYEAGLLRLKSWANIQDGPKFAVKLGLSAGFTKITSVQAAKQSLFERQMVQIGTGKIDWIKTIRDNDNVIAPGTCYNHSMMFDGYDDTIHGGCFIVRNSLGEFGKYRGRHFLKYEDFDILFPSKYAYIDKSNKELMDQYKAKMKIERAIKEGFISDVRLNEYGTRQEAVYVMRRIIPGATVVLDKWNPNGRCSRQEFIWLFQKYSHIMYPVAIERPLEYITRREMAIFAITMSDLRAAQTLSS